ncbi:metallophosphoesterase [Microbacterium keratanolyticum]|uniref:metallophosphoesterase n=1 Tax=Microbacterium keratanolyticum TaxID=67574 RepID=UPI00362746B2
MIHRARTAAIALLGVAAVLGSTLAVPTAQAAEDTFTIIVLPDTQGYTATTTYEQTMGAQTQWIVDSRQQLGTKFVIQVGDLVESWPNVNHWERASRYMKTLDDAGVPNSVLPGNHDLNITTGESSTYDTYFPPSRYANASWNSATVSYGGYLGQNLYGPDGIDRKNKDNFALLTVGTTKLLILNLEFESPAYTLTWAQKVLDAHPDREVILATHGFINTAGVRSSHVIRTDVTPISAVTLWNEFVSRNCSIFMVVNGHWHDGDLGEARRTDANSCGEPVHQILSDYQSRANGGNGWLRYYTFNPTAGTVDAYTYSPTLRQYETDDSSRFTLPIDLSGAKTEVLLPGGSTWKWRNSTQTWPIGWNMPGYSDASWGTGAAPLGWGTGVATVLDLAPPTSNRARAMIFRNTVTIADVDELSDVTVTTRADDGVAVWVNGTLIGTSHLQSTNPNSSTYADATRSTNLATSDPAVFAVPDGLLQDGANVIAASAHVNYRATANSTFDLSMTARRTTVSEPDDPPGAPIVSATATSPTSVEVAWSAGVGAPVASVEVARTGMTTLTGTGASGTVTDAAAPPNTALEYAVTAIGVDGQRSAPTVVTVTTPPGGEPVPTTLVAATNSWRYRYAAGAWPAGWTGVGFDDSTWSQGAAPLGFGSGITTVVDVPPPTSNRPISMIFRTSFDVADPSKLSALVLTARADDGVVVTVNGVEVGRLRMPTTAVSAGTYATAAPNTAAAASSPLVIAIPSSALVPGKNVIAASTHLNYRGTAGVQFTATLEGMTLP